MSDEFSSKGFMPKVAPSDDARLSGKGLESVTEPIVELAGHIKWFDVAKGFGFIVPDNGLPDVLVHVTCLKRDG